MLAHHWYALSMCRSDKVAVLTDSSDAIHDLHCDQISSTAGNFALYNVQQTY